MNAPNNEHKTEIISLWYHNELSIISINRKFKKMFTTRQISKIILESKIKLENEFFIIESILNYTNRL